MATSLCDFCDHPCGQKSSSDIEDQQYTAAPDFHYAPMFQKVDTPDHVVKYVKVEGIVESDEQLKVLEVAGRRVLQVAPEVLTKLAHHAMIEIQHYFHRDHLEGWARVLADDEASENDKFVARTLLQNACVAAKKLLPSCQDTGTALVMAKRGELVWTGGDDEANLSRGIWQAYVNHNLRYSQCAPTTMFNEVNTNNNLPVQFDMAATPGNEYQFLFIAKGGGSANKSMLFQQTKALLNPKSLRAFIEEKLKTLGTAACPPYHIALVIGGTSAELTMKTVKLASCRYLDDLPTTGSDDGRAFRDLEWEKIVLDIANHTGLGCQFGGKYFAIDARVIRLPRHGASCPVGLGVSCSADRQIRAKITEHGVYVQELEHHPETYLPAEIPAAVAEAPVVKIDLNQPMSEIRKILSQYPVKTRLSLSGPLIVARDIAHAKLKERLDAGQGLPEYFKERIVYYAGPAKTPEGFASGSFGPTTAGRMDSYLAPFMAAGGSFVSLAKGNRSKEVTAACKQYGGFYLGSIGGAAAILAQNSITKSEVIEYPELGMEAVWSIDVQDFPAFIIVDDKGNDFFAGLV